MLPSLSLSLASPAHAQSVRAEVDAGVAAGVNVFDGDVTAADPTVTQVEVDAVVGFGDQVHLRIDADLHLDLNDPDALVAYPSDPPGLPEWAALQIGREKYHLRLGLLNPNIGLEDWDPWVNYAPTYSTNFVLVGPGRFVGGEASASVGSTDLFVYGGYDADWTVPGGGVGVASSQDSWATWSGITVYPSFTTGCDGCLYVDANPSFEFYPADPLWIAADTHVGAKGSGAFFSEQLVVNVIPEAAVNPFARGEVLVDPDGVIGGPAATASLGARADLPAGPTVVRVMLEGKSIFPGGGADPSLGGALVVAFHTDAPNPYSFQDPFADEAEE